MAEVPLIDRIVETVLKAVTTALVRLFVHLAALCCAVFVVDGALRTAFYEEIFLKITIYAGIASLLPAGSLKNPYWFIPAATGCLQALVLGIMGMPWPWMLFWAGVQTWCLRLVIARGAIGWDWSSAPLLLICAFFWFAETPLWDVAIFPLVSFPVVLVAGAIFYKTWLRICHASVHRQIMASLLVRLRKLVQENRISGPELGYLRLLLSQCETLAVKGGLDEGLIDRTNTVTTALENSAQNASDKPLKGLFKSTQWQHLTRSPAERSREQNLLEQLRTLTLELARLIEPQQGTQDTSRLAGLSASASLLLQKAAACPAPLCSLLERIALISLDMVQCMEKDPGDVRDGTSFLNRYLPRVHHIADEMQRLQQGSVPIERTREVLERLVAAFREERQRMDRNDSINYNAEIDALDNLLKMRGY